MAEVLTTDAVIKCSHTEKGAGTVDLGSGSSSLTVGGKPVLTASDVVGKTITGCGNTSNNTTACQHALAMTSKSASLLKIGSDAVLLDSAKGKTDGQPAGTWSVISSGQSKLTAS